MKIIKTVPYVFFLCVIAMIIRLFYDDFGMQRFTTDLLLCGFFSVATIVSSIIYLKLADKI